MCPFSFQTGYDVICLASLWMDFGKTETHPRARSDCHVSTFPSRGVIILLVSELSWFSKTFMSFSFLSLIDIGCPFLSSFIKN